MFDTATSVGLQIRLGLQAKCYGIWVACMGKFMAKIVNCLNVI